MSSNAVVRFQSHQCAVLRKATCLCRGSTKETRGTAYVVYEDIYDAKTAVEHLSGFNVANRYLIVLYYNHQKHSKKVSLGASDKQRAVSIKDMAQTSTLCVVQHGKCVVTVEAKASSVSDIDLFAAEYQGQRGGAAQDAREVWSGCRATSPEA